MTFYPLEDVKKQEKPTQAQVSYMKINSTIYFLINEKSFNN